MKHLSMIATIVAVDVYNGFAREGKIPWYYPSDLRWFKYVTNHSICVMGRATYEELRTRKKTIGTDILPNRKTIVLSTQDVQVPGALHARNIEEAISIASTNTLYDKMFFLGGEKVFEVGLDHSDTLFITRIQNDFHCDRFFPMERVTAKSKYELQYFRVDNELSFEVYQDDRATLDINTFLEGVWGQNETVRNKG